MLRILLPPSEAPVVHLLKAGTWPSSVASYLSRSRCHSRDLPRGAAVPRLVNAVR